MQAVEGVEVFFAASHCTDRPFDPLLVLEGERGQVEMEYAGAARVRWGDGRVAPLAAETGDEAGEILADIIAVIKGRRARLACPLEAGRAQVVCTCGTFESAAVRDLPAPLISRQGEQGTVVMQGMANHLQRAWEEARLFSEMGLDWARPGEDIDLRDYRYFPTFRTQVE